MEAFSQRASIICSFLILKLIVNYRNLPSRKTLSSRPVEKPEKEEFSGKYNGYQEQALWMSCKRLNEQYNAGASRNSNYSQKIGA